MQKIVTSCYITLFFDLSYWFWANPSPSPNIQAQHIWNVSFWPVHVTVHTQCHRSSAHALPVRLHKAGRSEAVHTNIRVSVIRTGTHCGAFLTVMVWKMQRRLLVTAPFLLRSNGSVGGRATACPNSCVTGKQSLISVFKIMCSNLKWMYAKVKLTTE